MRQYSIIYMREVIQVDSQSDSHILREKPRIKPKKKKKIKKKPIKITEKMLYSKYTPENTKKNFKQKKKSPAKLSSKALSKLNSDQKHDLLKSLHLEENQQPQKKSRPNWEDESVVTISQLYRYIYKKFMKGIKKKINNSLQQQWIIYCRINLINSLKIPYTMTLMDSTGEDLVCVLAKDALDQFRQFLKIGSYYYFSRGQAVLTEFKQLNVTFRYGTKIKLKNSFPLNPKTILRLHNCTGVKQQTKIKMIGVIKQINNIEKIKQSFCKQKCKIILCDPVFYFEIQVDQVNIFQCQDGIKVGDVIVLHHYLVCENQNAVLELKACQQSYYTIQSNKEDQIVASFYKAQKTSSWKKRRYEVFKRAKFMPRRLNKLIFLTTHQIEGEVMKYYSTIKANIIKVQVGRERWKKRIQKSTITIQKRAPVYDMLITFDDGSQKMTLPIGWQQIQILTEVKISDYEQLCNTKQKQQIQTFFDRLSIGQIMMNLKSYKSKSGNIQHTIQTIKVTKKCVIRN